MNTPATNPTVTTCLTQPSKVGRKCECCVHRLVQLDLVMLLLVRSLREMPMHGLIPVAILEILDILYMQMHLRPGPK